MPHPLFWIVDIECSEKVEAKIARRGLTLDEVKQAVRLGNYETAEWHDDPDRGRRLIMTGYTNGGTPLIVILGVVDAWDGKWRLRSAWRDT